MKPVLIHLHNKGSIDWINKKFYFDRIPVEGEYITVDFESDWYKIEMVVHTPFSDEMAAEVYAVKVIYSEEIKNKLN